MKADPSLLEAIPENKKVSIPLLNWYQKNKEQHPWRQLWEKHKSPYYVWVSEIMLQQTVIKAVLPKYVAFMERLPDVKALAKIDEKDLRPLVSGLGYYNRFSRMQQTAKILCEKNNHRKKFIWPKSYQEWLDLPGIGPYTASAIASITLNEAVPTIDGNVKRVLARVEDIRLAIDDNKIAEPLQTAATCYLSRKKPGDYNQALMELGQKICRVQNPKCHICPLKTMCKANINQSVDLAPGKKKPKPMIAMDLNLYIYQKDQHIALFKRADNALFLKNRLGFLTVIEDKKAYVDGKKTWNFPQQGLIKHTFKHSITKYKLSVTVRKVKSIPKHKLSDVTWVKTSDLKQYLTASLDLKALAAL